MIEIALQAKDVISVLLIAGVGILFGMFMTDIAYTDDSNVRCYAHYALMLIEFILFIVCLTLIGKFME